MGFEMGQTLVEFPPRHLNPVEVALGADVDVHRHDGDGIFLDDVCWQIAIAVGNDPD